MDAIPETMIAIDPAAPGGPEVLQPVERPVPKPGPGEVLIRVEAAGVNRPDVMQRLGFYPPPPGAPTIPGLEVAGHDRRAGEGVAIGEPGLRPGRGRRLCRILRRARRPVPAGARPASRWSRRRRCPETFFTVWTNLFQRGGARAGDTVLVHGGTSGIGTTAILLGKAVRPDRHRHRRLGREMRPGAGDRRRPRDRLQGAGFRRGGEAHHRRRGRRGRCSTWSAATMCRGTSPASPRTGGTSRSRPSAAPSAEIPLWDVMRKRLTLTGSTLRARPVEFKAALAAELRREVWPHLEAGRIRPVIHCDLPARPRRPGRIG